MPSPRLLSALILPVVLAAAPPREAFPEEARSLMLQARSLQRRGGGDDPEGAAVLYRRVQALVPESATVHLRLAEALMEAGRLEDAYPPAARAVELDPRSAEAACQLGILQWLRAQARPDLSADAIRDLQRACRMTGVDADLWTRLATLCDAAQDDAAGLRAWIRVGRLHPQGTFRERPLTDYAFERVVELAIKLQRYEERREAVLDLASRPFPSERHLKLLQDLAFYQVKHMYLGHAEESFRILGRHLANEPAVWENIALIQLRTARYKEALESLRAAASLKPSPRVGFNMGLCLMKLGRFQEAADVLAPLADEPLADAPDVREALRVSYATDLVLLGRGREAAATLRRWEGWESSEGLLALAAQAAIQAADWKEARNLLVKGMERFPKVELFRRAAKIPARTLEDGRIIRHGARKLLLQAERTFMAGTWAEFRQWDRCLEALEAAKAAASTPTVDMLVLEAQARDQLRQPKEAIAALRQALVLEPDNALVQNNLGYSILEAGGDLEEAWDLIGKAYHVDGVSGATVDSYGWVLFRKGRFAEAEETLSRAVEMQPHNPEVRRHLGETLMRLKRYEEAIEQWEKALAYATEDRAALEERLREARVLLARQKGESGPDAPSAPQADSPDDGEDDE